MPKSEISSWYAGRSIFITGASGFMGKVLVEKLLYGCPEIGKLYVLLRPKREKSASERIVDMWKLPMFERLRKQYPDAIKKVVPINGELVSEGLGISDQDRKTLANNVSVVFHLAATLRLEGTLKDAVEMNTEGTLRIIELCIEIKKLTALVHLSTAFCNSDIAVMQEKVYASKDDPYEVIRTVKWMNEESLIKATKDIIHPHPNTYIYTKRLAEQLILDQFPKLPVTIARPSIVCPAAVEPLAGWVDNLNGPIGLMVGAGKGVIRSMKCNGEYPAHTVPVDLAINGLIAIGWKTGVTYAKEKPKEIPVYNMSQDGVFKVKFSDILNIGRKLIIEYPFEWCIWYPGGDMTTSEFVHRFYIIFFHFLPAYFLDMLLFIFRQKTFLVRTQRRITQGLDLLEFFTTNYWNFDCSNLYALWNSMSPDDRNRFSIDFEVIDFETYMKVSILGSRQYCVKENLSSLPRCRRIQKFLYVLDKLTTFFFFYFLLSVVGKFFEPVRYILETVKAFIFSLLPF